MEMLKPFLEDVIGEGETMRLRQWGLDDEPSGASLFWMLLVEWQEDAGQDVIKNEDENE
jgi:hypothetical protein